MVRKANRLTARTVASKTAPGLYGDGNNLYLQVNSQGARSWVFRYMSNGKARGMGLGPVDTVSLAEARQARHRKALPRPPLWRSRGLYGGLADATGSECPRFGIRNPDGQPLKARPLGEVERNRLGGETMDRSG